MIKKLLFFGLITMSILSCAKPDKFVIKGEIKGKESGKIQLMKFDNGRWIAEDSTTITKGKFQLTGKADLPELRFVALVPQQMVAQFFAENGTITIQAYNDSLDKSVVTGSKSNEEFKVYQTELMSLSKESQGMQQRFMSAQQSGDQDGMKKARIDYEAMVQNLSVYAKNFIREHKASTVSPLIAMMQFGETASAAEIDTLIKFLDPSVHPSIYVAELKKIAEKKRATDMGSMAPDFTLPTPDGGSFTLSSTRGKYVMIDFWAAWCQPCRHENPNVVALYAKYKDKGFDVVGVSLDREKDAWVKAIADDQLVWHQVSELKFWQSQIAQKYGVTAIPCTFLLDKEGKIIGKNLRGDDLANKLAELMGK
ncbi:MAG: AhpC/TSA family protein [Prolixibacteraceae bacterium]|nr:AhpC/TSA family protein [Prolixibacteraceae bacterium]